VANNKPSAFGDWNYEQYNRPIKYGDEATYHVGAAALSRYESLEDWGGGTGYFKQVMAGYNPACRVLLVDGGHSQFVDRQVNLLTYRSNTPAIFMRHVIEHNNAWETILRNACESFQNEMILILFTPFVDVQTDLYKTKSQKGPYIAWAFSRGQITSVLDSYGFEYTIATLKTDTEFQIEHVIKIMRTA